MIDEDWNKAQRLAVAGIVPPEIRRERWSAPESQIAIRLVRALGREGAHRAVEALVAKMSNVELAALAMHWPTWARTKQIAPPGDWISWGKLESRGTGKTKTFAHFITDEVQAGRARSVGLAAQNYTKTVEVQVGGLLRAAPPWFRPEWVASAEQLRWPNGAAAFARTPEVPDAIRSENHELSWLSELQSWPHTTREEAYSNFKFATRVGPARLVWDATPKRGHPILKRLLARSAADPLRHVVFRGMIHENPHLTRAVVEEMFAEYEGTSKGREELYGEMIEETERSLVKQAWIDVHRRPMPDLLLRRVISIDPAVTARAGSDRSGIIDAGLGGDEQMLVLGDYSGKHTPSTWGSIVIDKYVAGDCDCVVVETNKGGDLVTSNLRAAAGKRDLTVVVLGKDECPRRQRGTVYVREVHARGPKEDRAQPLATAYERGRVSHVLGVDLSELEETLTTWEPAPGQRSPDAIDAEAHAAVELLGLLSNRSDGKAGFRGIAELGKAVAAPPARAPGTSNIATLLGAGSAGGRI